MITDEDFKLLKGCCTLIFDLTSLSLSIAMIVMGVLNKNTCVHRRISTWLIAYGFCWFIQSFGTCFLICSSKFWFKGWLKNIRILAYIFSQIWIIYGNIWIYSVNKQDISTDQSICYNFSFGMITFLNICLLTTNSLKFYIDDLSDFGLTE
jgi:hypothetical protein